MAVLVTAEVQGQTQQGYDGMHAMLEGALKQARGLVLHTSHPVEDGWRVIEIWESSKDANDFFAKAVHPKFATRHQAAAYVPGIAQPHQAVSRAA